MKRFCRCFILLIVLAIRSLPGWGSDKLPCLSYNGKTSFFTTGTDTLPSAKKTTVPDDAPGSSQPIKDATAPIIKEVPKSRKQPKPVSIPVNGIPVQTPKIIKPKVVIIKKIGLL